MHAPASDAEMPVWLTIRLRSIQGLAFGARIVVQTRQPAFRVGGTAQSGIALPPGGVVAPGPGQARRAGRAGRGKDGNEQFYIPKW